MDERDNLGSSRHSRSGVLTACSVFSHINYMLLACAAATMQVDVVTSAVIPTHIARMDKDEATDPQAALSTYVDVALLARARCAIYSRSGFSNTGWMMGGGQAGCAAHFTKGLEQCVADAAAEVAASTTTITKQSGKAARS